MRTIPSSFIIKHVPDDEPFRDDSETKSDSLKFVEECSSQFINDETGDTTFEGFKFNNLKINFVNNELYYQFHEFLDDINTYEIGIESSYYSSLDDI